MIPDFLYFATEGVNQLHNTQIDKLTFLLPVDSTDADLLELFTVSVCLVTALAEAFFTKLLLLSLLVLVTLAGTLGAVADFFFFLFLDLAAVVPGLTSLLLQLA